MAVGLAAQVWQEQLSRQIRTLLENSDAVHGAGVSLFIYMVGKDQSTSSPKIIFCSSDIQARKAIREAVRASGILDSYPSIGLGDSSSPLARGDSGLHRYAPTSTRRSNLRSARSDQGNDSGAPQEPVGQAQGAHRDSEAGPATLATEDWQAATQHDGSTLIRPFGGMSIASSCPSYDSASGTLTGSIRSIPSGTSTPRSSVHDLLPVELQAHSNTPTVKAHDSDTPDSDNFDSADDPESYSESDDMEDCEPLSSSALHPGIARELNAIVSKILGAYSWSQRHAAGNSNQRYNNSESTGTSSNTEASSQSYRGPENGVSRVSLGKRPFLGQNDGDDIPAVDTKRAKTVNQKENLFACPYWKKDRQAYRGCFKFKFEEAKRIKQHLYRNHRKKIRCSRCQEEFRNRTACDDHVRNIDCTRQPEKSDEGIGEEHVTELNKRGPTSWNQVQRWYAIWRILFPRVDEPTSPYNDQSEDLNQFREFCQRNGATIIVDHMRTDPNWSQDDEERFSQGRWGDIFSAALDGIERQWAAQRAEEGIHPAIGVASGPPNIDSLAGVVFDSSPSPPSGGGPFDASVGVEVSNGVEKFGLTECPSPVTAQGMLGLDGEAFNSADDDWLTWQLGDLHPEC